MTYPLAPQVPVKWLVLPRLEVRGMNAQPSWWCVAAPGPMAARGLAQSVAEAAFGRGAQDLKGVGMVWHHFALRGEYIRAKPSSPFQDFFAHQHRAAALINDDDYASGSKTLSGQPSVRGDGTLTLVLAVDDFASIDLLAIEQRLNVGRFAGGTVVEHQFKVPRNEHQASLPRNLLLHDEWATVLKRIKTGYVFVDRSELIEEAMQAGAKDPLSAFLACTQAESRAGKAALNGKQAQPRSSWLGPYLAGYYGLTAVASRKMAREGHPHAFVEPLVGLGQHLSLWEAGVIPFWDYTDGGDGTYRVQEVSCFGGPKPAAKAYVSRAKAGNPSTAST